jgi:hypothetical protein
MAERIPAAARRETFIVMLRKVLGREGFCVRGECVYKGKKKKKKEKEKAQAKSMIYI